MDGKQNPKFAKAEVRNQYPNTFKVELWKAPCSNPGYCCFATFCTYCASFQLRKRALRGDMRRYVCCNGDWPCSGRCGERKCPTFCLVTEVICCFPQSVASTRWMIQDEMQIVNTSCDNAIIATMIAAQYLACICWIVACIAGSDELMQLARVLDWIADCMWCSVCACMQTQHKAQLDLRDSNPSSVPTYNPYMAPMYQQMGGNSQQVPQQHSPYYPPPQQQPPPSHYPPSQQQPSPTYYPPPPKAY